jgi:hypothetical protein
VRAYLNLRYNLESRRRAYQRGLERLGYTVIDGLPKDLDAGSILVTWNRFGHSNRVAKAYQKAGLPVLVAENAAWGNEFLGGKWNSIARNFHNTAGCFDYHGPERWDGLGFDLAPFRTSGETVILPQRGIGSKPTAMPKAWAVYARQRHKARVRKHPGKNPGIPLESDLARCHRVITWGSGAAIKALMMGIHVVSEMPSWIGEQDNTEPGRLDMFRRLAWAQWTLDEIASGLPFERLIHR